MLLVQFSEKHGMGITWFSAAYFVLQSCKWKYFWQPWVKKMIMIIIISTMIMKMIIVSVTIMVLKRLIHGKLFTIYYLTYIMNTLCKGEGLLTVSIFWETNFLSRDWLHFKSCTTNEQSLLYFIYDKIIQVSAQNYSFSKFSWHWTGVDQLELTASTSSLFIFSTKSINCFDIAPTVASNFSFSVCISLA